MSIALLHWQLFYIVAGWGRPPQAGEVNDLRHRVQQLEKELLAKNKEIHTSRADLDRKEGILRVAAGVPGSCMSNVPQR